jgi:hypothetical protein
MVHPLADRLDSMLLPTNRLCRQMLNPKADNAFRDEGFGIAQINMSTSRFGGLAGVLWSNCLCKQGLFGNCEAHKAYCDIWA